MRENNHKKTVTVITLAYNHEPYIRQCLDGIVMQKTNFAYELLIHDDASTDNTANIIREYEAKYPEIIKPIYQTENQYSKGGGTIGRFLYPRATGKYIAFCDGDDYWTDPYKLQKQVDFLEKNEEYSICFHNVKIWKEIEQKMVDDYITKEVPETTTIVDLANGNYIHTPSVMFRYNKKVFDDYFLLQNLPVGDYVLHMLNAKYGKIKKLSDTMAVYRVHAGGIWSEKALEDKALKWVKMIERVKPLFVEQGVGNNLSTQQEKLLSTALTNVIKDENKLLASEIFHLYIEYGLSDQLFKQFYNSHIQSQNLINSKTYRLGMFLLKPLLFIRKFLRK